MRLKNKKIFVTAAGQGIGRTSVEAMLKQGAEVLATDLNGDLLDGLDCQTLALNATDQPAVEKAIRDFQPDTLFNCAGFVHGGTIEEATEADMDFAFELNVKAMFHTIRAALPAMLKNGSGNIINMSSVAGSITGVPNRMVYSTTKAATSPILELHGQRMLDRNWVPGGPLRMHLKDLNNTLEKAAEVGLKLPLAEQAQVTFNALTHDLAMDGNDHSAYLRWLEEINPGKRLGSGPDQLPDA